MSESQETSQVLIRRDDRGADGFVAHVVLNNARRMNSLNSALMREFIEAVSALGQEERLRVVVVTGEGERAFAGGANVFELVELDAHTGNAYITLVHGMSQCLRDLPVPVIARINGLCLGAGLEIAAACDLRVATEDALLGMPEVALGLPSVVEAALFPQLIGWGRTKEIIYTAENISAAEALNWGLIERCVPRAQLDDAVERWVTAILKASPRAIRLQRELIRQWECMPINDAIQAGIRTFVRACDNDEPRRRVATVIERLQNKERR
jgi:enoyl-CoA hydratase/carnithine racemase